MSRFGGSLAGGVQRERSDMLSRTLNALLGVAQRPRAQHVILATERVGS